MCGFTGFYNPKKDQDSVVINRILDSMSSGISHRGPDASGNWSDIDSGIALNHTRLSIIDLSSAGSQPMISHSQRYIIAFNGEIYNHHDLRARLEKSRKVNWRGDSDTESFLESIDEFGIEDTLKHSTGMFAFALWDQKDKLLCIARDRLGEKPVYYGFQNDTFLFGSELKALKSHHSFKNEINKNSISLLMKYCYIPAPFSIYEGIFKLDPANYLLLSQKDLAEKNLKKPTQYWSMDNSIQNGISNPFKGSDEDAINALDEILSLSIKKQMASDVPLGAFLSGGIDSSTIVAIMQKQATSPVKTFTIGFEEEGYNEAKHAKSIAKYLGTSHHELYVSSKRAMEVIPKLPEIYDEPFSDSSQIPTYLVSKMTRENVTVSLSGDGADELFGGYNRYFWARSIWKKTRYMPPLLKKIIASGITKISPRVWNKLISKPLNLLPGNTSVALPGDKMHKLSSIFNASSMDEIYLNLISTWKDTSKLVSNELLNDSQVRLFNQYSHDVSFEEKMMNFDAVSYLPNDILCKVDRAAMAVSLETRVPFLDHNIVEFSMTLPLKMKIRDGQGKWILRKVLEKHVPNELTKRPKMGFGVPIDSWLQGPIKEWAESLINPSKIKNQGYLNSDLIQKIWQEHLSGERNWQAKLWNVLIFQSWLEKN